MHLGSKRWHRARRRRARIAQELKGIAYHAPYDDPYYMGAICCLLCHEELEWEECSMCGGEGGFDGYEDNPNYYEPGEMVRCCQCNGDQGDWWGSNRRCPTRVATLVCKTFPERITLLGGKVYFHGTHY